MTDQEINIAIAKACGWTHINMGNVWLSDPPLPEILVGRHPGYKMLQPVPRYTEDLNAVHNAVMSLPLEQRVEYRKNLQYIIVPETKPGKACGVVLMGSEAYDQWFNATARQRAEAFLKTLDLWKE